MLIVIDAGHGGRDPGALSSDGKVKESVLNLQMAKALAIKLRDLSHDVRFTRIDDTYLRLISRCDVANNIDADFFISIHVNSASSPSATGIETLVYSKPSNTALRYAERVQNNLIKATHAKDRGIKYRGDLTVLKYTRMPAILVETGFISNPHDCSLLLTPEYQNDIVTAIGAAFSTRIY